MRLRPLLAGAVALLAAACSSGMTQSPVAKPAASARVAPALKPSSPARYVLTQSQGAIFDEATKGVAVPRRELAIVMGRRVKLDGGVIVAAAASPLGVVGFRSLPERLGGGYLIWTDLRTYHAKDFLGALTPVAEIAPNAGARPWFRSVLLRTDRGIFELDLKTNSIKRWRAQPGVVEVMALDDKRAVTLDIVGRVRLTVDAGATWTDVSSAHGFFANAARLGKKGELELLSISGNAELRLPADGVAIEPIPPTPTPYYGRRYNPYSPYQYNYQNPYNPPPADSDSIDPISQQLATDALSSAAVAGLLLESDRAIVGRDAGGIMMLSTRTGFEITSGTLLGVATDYAGCQPVRAGATILLACAHQSGAEVLTLDGSLVTPKLEATFPDLGSFLADDAGHLAFMGRCGRTPPSADDFGARPTARRGYDEEDPGGYYGGYGPYGGYSPYGGYDPEYTPPDENPPEKDRGAPDEKRVCVRLEGGHWIEHRLTGDDAKDLYRWVLGDDGEVTALLLKGANPEEANDVDEDGPGRPHDEDDDAPMRRRSDRASPRPLRGALAQPLPPPPPPAGTARPSAGPATPPKAAPTKPGKPAPEAKKPEAKKPEAKKPEPAAAKDGMRLIRLDPKDRALKKGKWSRVPTPQTQPPWRSIDRNFWLEPDGSIRGWMHLGEESVGSDRGVSVTDDGEPEVVTTETGGRFAGVRVSPQGKVTILPLPAHVQSVIFGGLYGLARTEDDDDRGKYFETTDGGATWTEIEGPPVGDLEDAYDDSRFPGCSAVGCALSSGLVRVGWGSPKPAPPKKDKEPYSGPGADAFPIPRLPRLDCTFEAEIEAFPAPAPKPKTSSSPSPKKPSPNNSGLPEDLLSSLPPDLQEMIRSGAIPMPPGLAPSGLPIAPPAPAASANPSAKPAAPKAAKPSAPAKPPPPPPADIISLRTKPQTALGQLKDKSWVGDVVVPFEPTASVKHISTNANSLEKLQGYVFPVLGDRGVDLFLAWDRRRAQVGAGAVSLLPFDYNGRIESAVLLSATAGKSAAGGSSLVAFDEGKRVLALIQPDASRAFLRTARIPDPTRGKLTIARRLDAPGAAVVWYSAISGDVFVGPVDVARAEIGAFVPLASTSTLLDGALPECAAKPGAGPAYQFLADLSIPVKVFAHGGKSLFQDTNVPVTLLVRATAERLCIAGAEVRGSGRPLDLTAVFGPKSAAVARSRSSAEDPTKLSLDKLSCVLHEEESK